jgi:hypothetical protein
MPKLLTGYQLVREADDRLGIKTNYQQLRDYEDCGLIPNSENGRWPSEALTDLKRANELSRQSRALDRRVILRYLEDHKSIRPDKLQSALVSLASRVGTPVKKTRRIHKLLAFHTRHTWDPDSMRTTTPRKWTNPKPREWPEVLDRIDSEIVWNRADYLYHLDAMLKSYTNPQVFPDAPAKAVSDQEIPPEERLLLLVVWDIANHGKDWAKKVKT